MKRLLFAVAAATALACAGASQADTIDFSQFGPAFTDLPNVFSGVTTGGVAFTITGPGGGFEIRHEEDSWHGNFPLGTTVLWDTETPGSMTFEFATAITSITQLAIESNFFGPYVGTLMAYDASSTLLGTQSVSAVSADAPGTVPAFNFSAPGITKLVISSTNDGVGFALGGAGGTGGYAGVPEPASWAMMLVGFGGLGAVIRRRRSAARFATA